MYDPHCYIVDLRKWIAQNLPGLLRKTALLHFIWALLAPLRFWQRDFERRKRTNDLLARYDTSRGNLERLLNRLYDDRRRRIEVRYVEWPPEFKAVYVTTDIEDDSLVIGDNDPRNYIDAPRVTPSVVIAIPRELNGLSDEIGITAHGYILPGILYTVISE